MDEAPPIEAPAPDEALRGRVAVPSGPLGGVLVVATDEGAPLATATTTPDGAFALVGLPAGGAVTVRAIDPVYGTAASVVALPAAAPIELAPTNGGCQLFFDVSDARWLTSPAFLESWQAEPLEPACPTCPAYRWFWERPQQTPLVLRVDFTPDGVRSTVRALGPDGWEEEVRALRPRQAARLDRAIGLSGFWQLEHTTAGRGCADGSEWTIEAVASPGYRAVYRVEPTGTPVAFLGREWLKSAHVRIRRREVR